ncbi:MAG: RND multidrug efflux transporter; Acriflavin resistance protein [uncultured Gemmatimonadetes bacterium]|uniref:RND multidrug efflux transporter Acriflavin resistance protein n=1 Tax=uncultured Gemmatimonadota bacterium TaxID=203437 RepID=A0A6J4KDV6_9BACT|nr:MAG: RND multidrug efflux transporter; Acriflavin resistance protein [uncultured Gemmatimonadota bacterium]
MNVSRIAAAAVKNWQFTVVVTAMVVAMGANAWVNVPRAEDPTFPIAIYPIVAVYPGASPGDVERLVVEPIEEAVGELDGLKTLETQVEDGVAVIRAEFESGEDPDRKYEEVLREVNALRPGLPADLHSLEVERTSAADVNIVQAALVSEAVPYRILRDHADRLQDRVKRVPGVRDAEVWGAPEREVRVSLDLGRTAQLGIAPGQVLAAVGGESANIPGGSVDAGARRFNVKTSGDYTSLDEVRQTVVGGAAGSVVLLRDVADVRWAYADPTHIARFDGRRAVFVTATMRPGGNISRVRDGIHAELAAFERSLPAGVKLERGFDQSANVERRLGTLGRDLAIAIGLVLLTLLPLGMRPALIVMVSIPLSMAIGLTLLDATGFGINQMSIVGFVIALGLLVDDSIVVVENIARFLREGHSRREAAVLATRQIGVAVLGCTFTLIFAFLPLLFLPGTAGEFIRSMPLTVVYTVLASLVVSLTLIPFLASRFLRDGGGAHENVFLRALNRGIGATYAPVLHRALARPRATLVAAALLFLGSVALVPAVGFSLFPKAGTPQFLVDIEAPQGSTLAATDRASRWVERQLAGHPEVRSVFANVGHGNPTIYYNVTPRSDNPTVAQLFVLTHGYEPEGTPRMLDSLRARFAAYPDARIEVKEFENGPPVDAPVAIRLAGENLDTLRALAARVEGVLRATPGTLYVRNPVRLARTDLRVDIDRAKAGMVGIPTAEIDRTIRLAVAGVPAGRVRAPDGEEYAVQVRLPNAGRPGPDALDRVYVAAAGGAQVPLGQVARLRFESSPPLIQRRDQERSVTVTAFVRSGFNTDRVTREVMERLGSVPFPAGYRWTPAGEFESRQESFGGVGNAVIVAVFMVLAILVLEFRTFRSTLIVASVIPLGVLGGIVALWVTGYTLSFTATIGFVALIGIEIKNSILLVDFTNQLREEGMPLDTAIERAGEIRFLPIVLTTMTAIGGLLPLALEGSALYSPLAWVIIGGLLSSTLLARLVTPVLYKLLPPDIEPRAAPPQVTVPVGRLAEPAMA